MSKRNNESEELRLFIAVPINDQVRARLGAFQKELKKIPGRVSWVQPENLHLTLIFLGSVPAVRVAALSEVIDAATSIVGPFTMQITGTGFFGSACSPRALWCGVEEAGGALTSLHGELVAGLKERGFEVESRKFRPHLTLGRVRSVPDGAALTSPLTSAKNRGHGEVHVEQVHLLQSRQHHDGVTYFNQYTADLKGAPSNGGKIGENSD